MAELTNEQKVALDHARHLAENGAPIFVARPNNSPLGYRLPDEWQQTEPDPSVVDRWKPGMALCLVTGVLVDAVDIDPRNGGDRAALNGTMPTTYGQQSTPSGGTHYLVAPLGVRQGNAAAGHRRAGGRPQRRRARLRVPGADRAPVQGHRRGPPVRVGGAPEVGMLLVEDDDSGAALRSLMLAKATTTYDGPTYDGPAYDDLTDAQKQWADRHVAEVADYWRAKFADAVEWPDGETDDHGRGWEAMSRDCAWALAMLAVCPWTGLDEDDAAFLYDAVLPAEIAGNEKCEGKWSAALVAKAATRPVEPPPWPTSTPCRTTPRTALRRSPSTSPTSPPRWLARGGDRPWAAVRGVPPGRGVGPHAPHRRGRLRAAEGRPRQQRPGAGPPHRRAGVGPPHRPRLQGRHQVTKRSTTPVPVPAGGGGAGCVRPGPAAHRPRPVRRDAHAGGAR